MPRVAVSINPGYSVPTVTSRVGPNGRRVRDLGALIERKERMSPLALLNRASAYLLTRLFILAVWVGCFLIGAIGYLFVQF